MDWIFKYRILIYIKIRYNWFLRVKKKKLIDRSIYIDIFDYQIFSGKQICSDWCGVKETARAIFALLIFSDFNWWP